MLTASLRQRLQPLAQDQLRALSTSVVHHALPVTQEVPASEGLFSKLFGGIGPGRSMVPLTDPLPNVEEPRRIAPPANKPETETTTLANGVKIASEATYGPTATVGIFVNAGSAYETPELTGCSHLLEYMAFKTTTHRTHFRLVREVESMGANVVASASREQMVYQADVISSNVAEAVEVLSDAVLNPKFNPWEVNEQVKRLQADLKVIAGNTQTMLMEGLHEVAYTGGLGRPLLAPEDAAATLNADKLHQFVSENYVAPRIAVAGAGVSQQELLGLTEPLFGGLPAQSAPPQPASKYLGGDMRQFKADPLTHTALAFEFAGGWNDVKGSVAVTVFQYLMGGGGSFSAGGPGKGMHSRLYRRVLNQYGWMQNCSAFNSLYNDTGLVGIVTTADSSHAEQAVDVMCKELLALAKDVPSEELERAKKAAISQVLMNLESRAVVAEDIGRQILTYGHRKPVSEFMSAIQALKAADITKLVTKLLKSPVAMASIGDIASVPRYDEVSRRFK